MTYDVFNLTPQAEKPKRRPVPWHWLANVALLVVVVYLVAHGCVPTVKGANVRDYGAGGDDAASIQAAIDAVGGKETIEIPAGEYHLARGLRYKTTGVAQGLRLIGAGQVATRLVLDGPGPLLTLDGSSDDWKWQKGTTIENLSLIGGPDSDGHGLHIRANWFLTLRNLTVTDFKGDGIHILNKSEVARSSGDYDSSCYLTVENVELFRNNYGGRIFLDNNPGGCAGILFRHCQIVANRAGGLRLPGFEITVDACGFHANVGEGGLIFPAGESLMATHPTVGTKQKLIVRNCEFDTNAPQHIRIDAIIGLEVSNNRFIVQPLGKLPQAKFSILLGQTPGPGEYVGAVQAALITRNIIRNAPVDTPHDFCVIGSNATGVKVSQTSTIGWTERRLGSREKNQLVVDKGTKTVVEQP